MPLFAKPAAVELKPVHSARSVLVAGHRGHIVFREGAKITDADDADGTEQPDKNKDGENKKAAPHGVRKNGRHRQNGGRKNASGKLPKLPAENNGN